MRTFAVFLFSAALLGVSARDMNADSLRLDSMLNGTFNLGEIVVTGTRAPKLLKDTPVQTRLITAKDIAKADAGNIEELLQQEMPGIEFSYAMNQQVHLNFGGFGGQGVLFLVDGERLAGETMDDVDFNRLDMSNVERIEIVRGASSALYGSSAGGGVINIITRKAKKSWSANFNGRYGRHAQRRLGATLSTKGKNLSNTFSVYYSGLDNYDVKSADKPVTRVVSTIYGHDSWNFKDKLTWTPLQGLDISGRAGYYYKQIVRESATPERYRDYSAGARADWHIDENDHIELNYSFDQYDKSTLYKISGRDVRNYSNVQNSIRGVFNHTFGRGDILTVGADFMHDYLMNSKLDGRERQQNSADVFVQYDWIASPKWEVVATARYDYFSDGSLSRLTPKLSVRYRAMRNLNLRLAYGMGFRAPTLKEKYYEFDMAGIWIVKGNPALKPEQSHNVNFSADYTRRNYNFTLTAYYNRVIDKISTGMPYYIPGQGKIPYLDYINLDRYNIVGGELTAQAAWNNGMSAKISYSYTHERASRDKEGNTANRQYIPARPHSLTARVDWHKAFSRKYEMTVGLNGRFLSAVDNCEYADYYDIAAGTINVHYPAYTLWKLSLSQVVCGKFKINLALDNIFNYKPKYYYLNSPLTDGVNFQAGLSIDL